MAWSAVIGAAGAIGGALISKNSGKQSGSMDDLRKLDPRFDSMMFGANGQDGVFGKYQSLLNQPQNGALQRFGQTNMNYLDGVAPGAIEQMRQAGSDLLTGNAARASLPAYAVGNMVQAPSQNKLNLSGSYNSLINGPAGANPYLTGAIQKGINQSTNAFQGMQQDATKNLTENILPGIRSNAVLAGQVGGSRQGLAEGRALGDFGAAMARATSQFGQNNTDAAVAAQAGAYDTDRNRQLAATQGLGAQQYGVAQQDAATKNAAEFMNVGNLFDSSKINAGLDLAGKQAGAGMLGGLNGSAYGVVGNQDNYTLNRAQAFNGLMTPWAALTGSNSQPLYQNNAGNMLGGGLMGMQFANGMFGGKSGNSGPNPGNVMDLFSKNWMNY